MGLVSSACDPMTNPPPAFPVAWCCFDHVQSPDKSTQHMIANAHFPLSSSIMHLYIIITVSALWARWASESEIISEASDWCAYSFGGLSDLISKNPDRRNSSILIPPKTWSGSVCTVPPTYLLIAHILLIPFVGHDLLFASRKTLILNVSGVLFAGNVAQG